MSGYVIEGNKRKRIFASFTLRMTLLLNKYTDQFIQDQFNRVFQKFRIEQSMDMKNCKIIRKEILNIDEDENNKEKLPINYGSTMFFHFTYCSSMKAFPSKFHLLRQKYFNRSSMEDIIPALGVRNGNNLQ